MTGDKDPRKKRFYHGGADGLKVRDFILPAKETGKNNMDGKNPQWREDRVYLTKIIGDACVRVIQLRLPWALVLGVDLQSLFSHPRRLVRAARSPRT